MKMRRFIAKTSHEALRNVKEELGADAVILSNKQVDEGIEIVALASNEMSSLVNSPESKFTPIQPLVEKKEEVLSVVNPNTEVLEAIQQVKKESNISEALALNIINEIQAMRHTLEDQLNSVAWGSLSQSKPETMKLMRTLLNAGFSPLLSRHLLEKLTKGSNYEESLKQTVALLTLNLRTATSDQLIENGGVYALIGPTGVGKTTTIAKLAARAVIRHGADKVALLTTDSYRIGGHEQLRIYGKLLGIPVRSIKDIDDLQLTLLELRSKHIVLIDTVGMSQRDQMVSEQMALLCDCGTDIKHLLLLNATSNGGTLDEVISAYQYNGIEGCIITKVDEAVGLGTALDVVIRRKLVLHYVTNGQKVPEDLHAANSRYLLHKIFKPIAENSPYSLQDPEFALVMASYDRGSASKSKGYAEASYE